MKSTYSLEFLEEATETLRAVAHPIRMAIIDLLAQEGQLSVTSIYEALDIEQAVASHHLRILKNKSVVSVQRDQKFSLYSLTNEGYQKIVSILQNLLEK